MKLEIKTEKEKKKHIAIKWREQTTDNEGTEKRQAEKRKKRRRQPPRDAIHDKNLFLIKNQNHICSVFMRLPFLPEVNWQCAFCIQVRSLCTSSARIFEANLLQMENIA